MNRTDIHTATNLVTEDYTYVGYADFHYEDGFTEWTDETAAALPDAETPWQYAGRCGHCGNRIRYAALLRHDPTQTILTVGERCLGNRFERSSSDFHAMRKQAALDRQRQRIKRARQTWFAVDPDREVAFTFASEQVRAGNFGWEGMRHSFVSKVNRYGSTSDKFVAAIMRDMVRTERREAVQAERDAAKAELGPMDEGRYAVEGKIIKIDWKETDFGSRAVMTVRDDRDFLVWGTVPASVQADLDALREQHQIETGFQGLVKALDVRVKFTATIERSDRDQRFGFFKRPTKAAAQAAA